MAPNETAARMAAAACQWLDSLSADQKREALYPVPASNPAAERERTTWFYTPTNHGGLPLAKLKPAEPEL